MNEFIGLFFKQIVCCCCFSSYFFSFIFLLFKIESNMSMDVIFRVHEQEFISDAVDFGFVHVTSFSFSLLFSLGYS